MRAQAAWKVMTHIARVRRPSSSSRRSRISWAALLVKVMEWTALGCARPLRTRCATRWVSTRVLPEPAPARMSSGPSPCSTASRWGGFSPERSDSTRSAVSGDTRWILGAPPELSPVRPFPPMPLTDDVRAHAERVARTARSVRIDLDALTALDPGPEPEMAPVRHYLEGSEADVASYLLVLDTINFGSGWFPTLRKSRGASGYFTVAWGLADRWRAHGPWTNAQLRAMRTEEIAAVLGQPGDHELMALFAQALRQLGAFLRERSALDLVREAGGSAERLAELLATGMSMYRDRGFYKRAQIVPHDLALAGVARFVDLERLTIFADNLLPHVLRLDGVLRYDARLAAHIDAGRLLRAGPQERELRASAVHAVEQAKGRLGMTAGEVDHALWAKGQGEPYKATPRPRCRTIFY